MSRVRTDIPKAIERCYAISRLVAKGRRQVLLHNNGNGKKFLGDGCRADLTHIVYVIEKLAQPRPRAQEDSLLIALSNKLKGLGMEGKGKEKAERFCAIAHLYYELKDWFQTGEGEAWPWYAEQYVQRPDGHEWIIWCLEPFEHDRQDDSTFSSLAKSVHPVQLLLQNIEADGRVAEKTVKSAATSIVSENEGQIGSDPYFKGMDTASSPIALVPASEMRFKSPYDDVADQPIDASQEFLSEQVPIRNNMHTRSTMYGQDGVRVESRFVNDGKFDTLPTTGLTWSRRPFLSTTDGLNVSQTLAREADGQTRGSEGEDQKQSRLRKINPHSRSYLSPRIVSEAKVQVEADFY